MPHICLPNALECRAITPRHHTIAVTLACLEVSLVLGLFILGALPWQTVIVLHHSIAIRSTVLECAAILISILVIDLGQLVQSAVTERSWLNALIFSFHLLVQVSSTGHWCFALVDVLRRGRICFSLENVPLCIFKFD